MPATSSGFPILWSGIDDVMASLNFSKVAAIIFDSNGPQAIVFELREVQKLINSCMGICDTMGRSSENIRNISLAQMVSENPREMM